MKDEPKAWWICVCIFLILVGLGMLPGCTIGPLVITHKEGSMPKGHVTIPLDGKLTVRGIDTLYLKWHREFR